MIREKTKSFEFQGRRWQVAKVSALDGSNIIRKFTTSGKSNPQEFLQSLPDEQFMNIQNTLLLSISEVQTINNQEIMLPIITPSGMLSNSISEDAGLIYMLTVFALAFNLQSFFDENALKEFQSIAQTFNA
ncbi:hypothetical protein LLG34_02475 [bacterium]|nr:hypothetical protein [bacterium]